MMDDASTSAMHIGANDHDQPSEVANVKNAILAQFPLMQQDLYFE